MVSPANRTVSGLSGAAWPVLPQEEVKLPRETKASRYYAARETDANPVRTAPKEATGAGAEQEKFLFYRGVGTFAMPLSARALGMERSLSAGPERPSTAT